MPTPDRKEKRAVILRRIIYLKRRCNRCYLVNVMASLTNVIVHGASWFSHSELISGDLNLYYQTMPFVVSSALMLVGSISSLYAMTKKLKKMLFFFGHVLMTASVLLAVFAVLVKHFFAIENGKQYGYPLIYIEDCEGFPDHTFSFILTPRNRRGRPVIKTENNPVVKDILFEEMNDVNSDNEATTEAVTYETYHCPELLANKNWLRFLYYMMWSFLIVISVTVILSYFGILHLICLTRSRYLVLHPWIVEPYQDYDEVLAHAQMKVDGELIVERTEKEMEQKRQEFAQMNVNMDFLVLDKK